MDCKAAEIPIESNLKLQPTRVEEVIDRDRFQWLVGRLIYLSHTRPVIAFVVSMLVNLCTLLVSITLMLFIEYLGT